MCLNLQYQHCKTQYLLHTDQEFGGVRGIHIARNRDRDHDVADRSGFRQELERFRVFLAAFSRRAFLRWFGGKINRKLGGLRRKIGRDFRDNRATGHFFRRA